MKLFLHKMLLGIFLLAAQLTFAQSNQISGTVSDESGEPLLGVSVLIKGSTTGTQTDINGKYSLVASSGNVIVFSYLGLKDQEVTVAEETTINVTLVEDAESLGQVVIVAQGVKAKPRSLTYSVQTVTSDELDRSKETNVVNALSAKAAGVQVTASSGSVGASANIRIRGNSSILGNNGPLFIVDGVPIDNSSTSEDPSDPGNSPLSGTDFSNRAVDLNSADIETVTVLKGLSAQALYGIRAANGVILITTKKGRSGKTKVSITSNTSFSQYNKVPTLQRKYSQGGVVGGVLTYRGPETFEGDSWGPAISTLEFDGATDYPFDSNGRLVPVGTGNGQAANAYDHYDFFKTGVLQENNFSVSGGSEKVQFRGNIGRLTQTGISPNEEFDRNTFRADINAQLDDKFDLELSGQYSESGGNRVQRGSNISGIMLGLIRSTPTFDNGNGLTGQDAADNQSSYFYDIAGQELPGQRSYRDGIYNNPYFTVAQNKNLDDVSRFIGKMALSYKINDENTLKGSLSVDKYTDVRKSGFNLIDASFGEGRVLNDNISNQDLNWNLILTGSKQISEDLGVSYLAGYDGYRTRFSRRSVIGDGLTIPSFFDISNAGSINAFESGEYGKTLIGAFVQGTFNYKDLIYVTPTFRNDWSSTLPVDNNSFQSYSLGTSFVFTELMDNEESFLDYGKFRMSYGSVGSDAPLFATGTVFGGSFIGGDGFIQGTQFPAYDTVSYERSVVAGNPNLKPESLTEFETGIELKMLDNRLRVDLAYYSKTSKDVIIPVSVSSGSGFTSKFENIAEISNKGVEVVLSGTPIRTEDFKWNVDVNWTTYENMVEELAPGVEEITLAGFSSTRSTAVAGQPYGAIYGSRFQRDENGDFLIDADGYPLAEATDGVVGDPTPDWQAGISNTFTYKDLSLSFLIDIRKGGDVWCGTCGIIDYFGTSDRTLAREDSRVFQGTVAATGQPNTQSVALYDTTISENNNFWRRYGFGGLSESNIYDGSWVRLREVTLSYSLPSSLLSKTFIDNASISVYGRNLWLSTDYPGVDPETNLAGDSNGIGLDYFNQPNTKSYGVNLRLNF
ncbi:SusC/RagA family TonB-linked outer membrane protein [Nonlabens arenilitoris]|uniref:SusC/RagA family TonB-linked outer membrane protein n=1 Tax=Nonlabens arenilitoris TaxID=1217969 RepID=A0A2S7U8S8_9FLAO|nr:SusC/RagA family TonB-linked outer membrane protein [Nonlabens arenilitoris]PQJ31000.1 SusC/RagA family TonB-linked outer membrane protein [Nonlabens arenilitoris]